MRDHGRGAARPRRIGRNSRMDPIQAAVLHTKLPRLADWTLARRAAADKYRELLPGELLDWAAPDPLTESHHLFPVLVDDREGLAAALKEAGIATGVHYRVALPDTTAFADSGDDCPNATWRAAAQLSLPMHPHLDDEAIDRIVAGVSANARAAQTPASSR